MDNFQHLIDIAAKYTAAARDLEKIKSVYHEEHPLAMTTDQLMMLASVYGNMASLQKEMETNGFLVEYKYLGSGNDESRLVVLGLPRGKRNR